jgi:hypothetical protein
MKRIVIFDLTHYEMVSMWLSVLEPLPWFVCIITSEEISVKINTSHEIDEGKIKIIVTDSHTLKKAFNQANNVHLFIFNTIDSNYKLLADCISSLGKASKIITLHNLRTWLNPPFTLDRIALINYFNRWRILRQMNGIVVLEKSFSEYVGQKTRKKFLVFDAPYSLMEADNLSSQTNETLHIGIPGNIDGNLRRDYNLCADTIRTLLNNNINLKFTFAGAVVGEHGAAVKRQLDDLIAMGAKIEFVYNPNSNKDFDEAIINCDLILMPVNVNTVFEGIREIYGKTKATGVIFDGIRFQKPILAPNNFSVPEYLKSSCVSYSTAQECAEIITKLSANRLDLFQLQENAKINAKNFSIENVRKRLIPHLNKLLSEQ